MPFLIIFWFGPAFLASIINGMFTAFDAEHETNYLKYAFHTQICMWKDQKDELNLAGRIILCGLLTVWILPSNLLLLFIKCLVWILNWAWNIFSYIFRKREKKTDENLS